MTFAQCQADAQDLKTAMLDWGIRSCSIELQEGRGTDPWLSARKYLRMHHHTVSRWCLTCALTPVLGVVKNGRTGLPGPLANGYGGYDGIYRIICMGLANHPGEGGPVTIDGVHVPANSAREPTWGTEWEGGLQEWADIAIPYYPGGMLEFMGRADNALAEWSGRPLTSQLEHSTWTDRKIDRLHITRTTGIALTQRWKDSNRPEEDDMPAVSIARDGRDGSIWQVVNFEQRRWLFDTDQINICKIYWFTKGVPVDESGDWTPAHLDAIGIVPGTPVPDAVTARQRTATNEDVAWAGGKIDAVKMDTEALLSMHTEEPAPTPEPPPFA